MKFGWDLRPSVCPVPLLVTFEPVGQANAQQDVTDKEKLWERTGLGFGWLMEVRNPLYPPALALTTDNIWFLLLWVGNKQQLLQGAT